MEIPKSSTGTFNNWFTMVKMLKTMCLLVSPEEVDWSSQEGLRGGAALAALTHALYVEWWPLPPLLRVAVHFQTKNKGCFLIVFLSRIPYTSLPITPSILSQFVPHYTNKIIHERDVLAIVP